MECNDFFVGMRRKKSPQEGLLAEAVRFELTEGVNPR